MTIIETINLALETYKAGSVHNAAALLRQAADMIEAEDAVVRAAAQDADGWADHMRLVSQDIGPEED